MTCRCAYDPFDHYYLESFSKLAEHEDIATARAIYYCNTHQICPPPWLLRRAASLLIELLRAEKSTGRGKRNRLARFMADYSKLERWAAVETVLSMRETTKRNDASLKDFPEDRPGSTWSKWHNRTTLWLKKGTYQCAADVLEGEYSNVTPSSIQNGHLEVQKAAERGSLLTFTWFDDEFLYDLDVKKRPLKGKAKRSRFF